MKYFIIKFYTNYVFFVNKIKIILLIKIENKKQLMKEKKKIDNKERTRLNEVLSQLPESVINILLYLYSTLRKLINC